MADVVIFPKHAQPPIQNSDKVVHYPSKPAPRHRSATPSVAEIPAAPVAPKVYIPPVVQKLEPEPYKPAAVPQNEPPTPASLGAFDERASSKPASDEPASDESASDESASDESASDESASDESEDEEVTVTLSSEEKTPPQGRIARVAAAVSKATKRGSRR